VHVGQEQTAAREADEELLYQRGCTATGIQDDSAADEAYNRDHIAAQRFTGPQACGQSAFPVDGAAQSTIIGSL